MWPAGGENCPSVDRPTDHRPILVSCLLPISSQACLAPPQLPEAREKNSERMPMPGRIVVGSLQNISSRQQPAPALKNSVVRSAHRSALLRVPAYSLRSAPRKKKHRNARRGAVSTARRQRKHQQQFTTTANHTPLAAHVRSPTVSNKFRSDSTIYCAAGGGGGGGSISGPFIPAVLTGLSRPSKNFPTGFVDGARFSIGVTGSSGNI